MQLKELFEIQAGLDIHIEKEHPTKDGEERLYKKILALHVEFGELANELPEVFKFWSNKKNNRKKALKEYVDCFHFILSIGNELHHRRQAHKLDINFEKNDKSILWHFNSLIATFSDLWNYGEIEEAYGSVIKTFLDLGELIGFTYEEIEAAYLEKNQENHQRQLNGY